MATKKKSGEPLERPSTTRSDAATPPPNQDVAWLGCSDWVAVKIEILKLATTVVWKNKNVLSLHNVPAHFSPTIQAFGLEAEGKKLFIFPSNIQWVTLAKT